MPVDEALLRSWSDISCDACPCFARHASMVYPRPATSSPTKLSTSPDSPKKKRSNCSPPHVRGEVQLRAHHDCGVWQATAETGTTKATRTGLQSVRSKLPMADIRRGTSQHSSKHFMPRNISRLQQGDDGRLREASKKNPGVEVRWSQAEVGVHGSVTTVGHTR